MSERDHTQANIQLAKGDQGQLEALDKLLNTKGIQRRTNEPPILKTTEGRKDAKVAIEDDDEPKTGLIWVWGRRLRPLLGMFTVFMASLSHLASLTLVKKTQFIDPFTMCAYRFVVFALMALPIVIYRGDPIAPAGYRLKLIARSLLGASVISINFFAIQHVPIGEVNMISAGAPAVTVFIAYFALKEPVALHDFINMFLVAIGMLFIAQPPFLFGANDRYGSLAYVVALISLATTMVIQSTVYVIIRMMRDLHFSTMLFFYGCVGFIGTLITAFAIGNPRLPQNLTECSIILAVGILSFASQTFVTLSLKLENAAITALLRKTFDITLSFFIQFILFLEFPNVWGIVGISLILLVVFTSGLRKVMQVLPPKSPMRKILGHLLCTTPLIKEVDPKEFERTRQLSLTISENEVKLL